MMLGHLFLSGPVFHCCFIRPYYFALLLLLSEAFVFLLSEFFISLHLSGVLLVHSCPTLVLSDGVLSYLFCHVTFEVSLELGIPLL